MKLLIGAIIAAIALIGIPIALVTVPAAAVRESSETSRPAADPEAARIHCGVRMECLQ